MQKTFAFLAAVLALTACAPVRDAAIDALGRSSNSAESASSSDISSERTEIAPEIEDVASSPAVTGSGAIAESVTADGFLFIGNADATKTLTVFTNASCDYCREFGATMLPRLIDEFVSQGKLGVRIAVVPLKKYADSNLQAAAILCASAEKKGTDMHRALMTGAFHDRKTMLTLVKKLGLSATFATCLDAKKTKDAVAAQQELIAQGGVTLIPAFELGTEKKTGLPSYADLRGWIRTR